MKNLLNITRRLFAIWFVLLMALALCPQDATAQIAFDREHSFLGGAADGASPEYGSTLTAVGPMLFGVTMLGGASNFGTLFLTSTNLASVKVLHSFNGYSELNPAGSTNDGAYPYGTPLVVGKMIFGTTSFGGTNGVGIIYAINTNGTGFTILHHFNGQGDGYDPLGSLVLAGSTLFGMTQYGTNGGTAGTIFSINTNGTGYQTLYTFGPGGHPYGALLVAGTNLYGMSYDGGSNSLGNIFVIGTNGGGFTDLHSFTGEATDGAYPFGSLIMSGTTLYGVTSQGGSNSVGTVFSMSANGSGFTVLHNFSTGDTWMPMSDLTISGSILYGMTQHGGINSFLGGGYGSGTVFQINTDGSGYRILHSFEFPSPATDGSLPYGPLLLLNNELYGMTSIGGSTNRGVIFALNPNGLPIITASNALPVGDINAAYSVQLAATGGTLPYTWTLASGSLPTGLKLSSSGLISGKPTAEGTFYFSIKVTDHVGNSSTQAFSLSIVPPDPALTVTITYPTNGQQFLSPLNNIIPGIYFTATGNFAVYDVRWKLNNGPWLNTFSYNPYNYTNSYYPNLLVVPGTNTVYVFAEDIYGNVSKTNSVKFLDVVDAELTVRTNGSGSIKPALNGAELLEGATYSMTAATTTKGVIFSNWTDGSNNIVTNGATVKFTMVTNLVLVANFADITKPTLSITAPTANEKWSNMDFTVSGKAADNVAVSNVWVTLNGGSWTNASLSNGGSNWTEQVSLIPGTNTVAAYAVDTSGNVSLTNTVKVVYILSATLAVGTNGAGSITPNYNGATLQIGAAYTMTAKATTGFGFVNWTDGSNNIITNGATLKFLMASNLDFVANFADITKPVLSITTPVANEKWSNIDFTVSGKATDNVAVSNVWVALNGGSWTQANLTNTTWSEPVSLIPGTNTIAAYAVDTSGNVSPTNTVKLVATITTVFGSWNLVQFQTPAQITNDVNNVLQGGNNFSVGSGNLIINTNGTLSGTLGDSFTGDFTLISNGVINANIITSGNTQALTFYYNANKDTMTEVDSVLDDDDNQQEIVMGQRAPAAIALADLAGSWNMIQFQTPAQVTDDMNNFLQGGDNFAVTNGTLTIKANGTASGTLGSAFTGTFTVVSNGAINVSVHTSGGTLPLTFYLNANKDIMTEADSQLDTNNNQQETVTALRVPASVTLASLAGSWNLIQFVTPAQITNDMNNLAQGGFGVTNGTMTIAGNGIVNGNFGVPFTGNVSVGSKGAIHANIVPSGESSQSFTFYLNAGEDTMIEVRAQLDANNNQQEMVVAHRMPAK